MGRSILASYISKFKTRLRPLFPAMREQGKKRRKRLKLFTAIVLYNNILMVSPQIISSQLSTHVLVWYEVVHSRCCLCLSLHFSAALSFLLKCELDKLESSFYWAIILMVEQWTSLCSTVGSTVCMKLEEGLYCVIAVSLLALPPAVSWNLEHCRRSCFRWSRLVLVVTVSFEFPWRENFWGLSENELVLFWDSWGLVWGWLDKFKMEGSTLTFAGGNF